MTKEEKIKWRLSKLPTVEELRDLVKDKIITNDEARKILFSIETEDTKTKEETDSEIKFLRELVDKLSENRLSTVVKYIEHVYPTYKRYDWPYWYVGDSTAGVVGGSINCSSLTTDSSTTFAKLN